LKDRCDDDVQLPQHLQIGKPQEPQALLFKVGGAHLIPRGL
jgi:hypothetical protein